MRPNIFLKSTLRQPVRTVFLLLLIGVLSFTFTLRAGEYLLTVRESERIGGQYRAIGELVWDKEAATPDFETAAGYLEQAPYVETVNLGIATSGVFQEGLYNVNMPYGGPNDPNSVNGWDVFFRGELLYSGRQRQSYGFVFRVEEVLGAYPEYLEPGKEVILWGTNLGSLQRDLVDGGVYLLRGHFNVVLESDFRTRQPLLDSPKPDYVPYCIYEMKPLYTDGPLFLEVPEPVSLTEAALIPVAEELRLVEENRRAMYVQAYTDVSASRRMQESDRTFYLASGRWPDRADNDAGRRVCAIHRDFAEARGLQVGDTLTLKLRSLENVGFFGDCAEENPKAYGAIPTRTETFEIVGIFGEIAEVSQHFQEILIPLSAYPDSFPQDFRLTSYTYAHYWNDEAGNIHGESVTENRMGTFVLTAPREQAAFLAETRDELAAMGLRAEFLDSGWEAFQAAVVPVKESALSGALLFAGILALALSLACFLYFRFRRKELAVCRALGVPAAACTRAVMLPLGMIGGGGILTGCAAAKGYLDAHAGQMLEAFASFGGGEASLPGVWFVPLLARQLALLLGIGVLFILPETRSPVLRLIQGSSRKQTKQTDSVSMAPDEGVSDAGSRAEPIFAAAPLPAGRKPGVASLLRFAGRYARRSPAKGMLIALLAASFTVGLAWIQVAAVHNEAELNKLYDTVRVELNVVRANTQALFGDSRGFLRDRTVKDILNSGYIAGSYLEAEIQTEDVRRIDPETGYMLPGEADESGRPRTVKLAVQTFSNPEKFFSDGMNIAYRISWLEGWDEGIFTADHGEEMPVVIPRALYQTMDADKTGRIGVIFSTEEGLAIGTLTVAGVYDGGSGKLLAPLWVMEAVLGDGLTYCKAAFSIDPSRNRDLEVFREELQTLLDQPDAGTAPMTAVLWDQELTGAVRPLERVITFMRTLYPIVAALSALASAGITLLVTVTLSRDAAIFRVLGNGRRRTRAMLWLQTLPMCLCGLLAGLTAVWFLTGGPGAAGVPVSGLGCAGLYLLAAVLAAVGSGAVMTARNPLELLQVKE